LDNKDIITLIGFIVTIVIGLLNLKAAKSNRFTSSINTERLKWINNIREAFSQFNKHCYIYANAIIRAQEEDKTPSKEEDYTFPEIVYYADLIKLYINPTEVLSDQLQLAMDEMLLTLTDDYFDKESYKDIKLEIHYYQQVILKAEWKRMKREAKLGRELDKAEMKEIFISTSSDIDNERYFKFLKEGFENQNNGE
jgi:hypothetical protein